MATGLNWLYKVNISCKETRQNFLTEFFFELRGRAFFPIIKLQANQ